MLCLKTLSVAPIKRSRMTGLSVNDELEGMWKTGVAAEIEVQLRYSAGRTKEYHEILHQCSCLGKDSNPFSPKSN